MLLLIVGTGASQFHKEGKKSVKTPPTGMGRKGYTAIFLHVCIMTAQMLPCALISQEII